ncbi:ATP-binding protein [Lyngbya sp. PCC 8106]|uniref:ATP-binding protein n=1 Tax=Lyngbya sp. (strain PCC 8106) TaxID=313612 RepID=UPI0000EA913F|nr:DUF499 domain-containing protein [Lyngbya sp. PCC 8106]EAW33696.1 hypothetical protein L8106_27269 [Lyngbya sp. PCC 8106]
MTAYQLKPWTQVVTPHADILAGNLDNATYAAKLGSVIRNEASCPLVYRDARKFFEATYLTGELKNLLESVLKRLGGEPGDRVLQLRTPFGGGKTHALVSLYHIAKSRSQLQNFPLLSYLPDPGEVSVAAFIGLDVNASTGIQVENGPRILTPWGYLAWQLGGQQAYNLVKDNDENRIAPGNNEIRQILGDRPNLILMDEFLIYVENAMGLTVGDSTFGRQVLTFIQKLTEVVADRPKTVLVYSLQASVQEAVGNEGLLSTLDKLVARNDAKKEPVSGDEVMQVVQKRLFSNIGNPEIIKEVARQQAELFRKFQESYASTKREKQEVERQANLLAERIEYSYPFHPDLLDLMYHRWGSLPSYQRTRGALQFLASVIYSLKQSNDNSWLITPGNIDFNNEAVRNNFFSQVGERDAYNSVINADLIGRKAKVNAIDKRIANDSPAIASLKVGSRLASAILMYSFGARGGEDRGVLEQDIVASCLAEGLERTIITTVLSDLRDELLYLHYVGKRYRFETKPNLNKLIADEESKVTGDEVLELIRNSLNQNLQKSRGKVVLWPKDSAAIPDKISQFIIVYLDPSWAEKSQGKVKEDALIWWENRGNDKRDYKNALAFIVPNLAQMDKARKGARTALAIASLLAQKKKYKFSAEDGEELGTKEKEANSEVEAALRRLYEYIILPVFNPNIQPPNKLEIIDLHSQINTSHKLQERVFEALKNHVFDSLTSNKLLRISQLDGEEKDYIQAEELVSYFFRFPNYPKLLGVEPIKTAILQAIEKGNLGYVPAGTFTGGETPTVENAELISFNCKIPADELDLSGYLLSSGLVNRLQEECKSANPPEEFTENAEDLREELTPVDQNLYSVSTGQTSVAKEDIKTVEYKSESSSIVRRVSVDIKDGKKVAKCYKLSSIANKTNIFQLFEVLQTLSDKAEDMVIKIEVKAHTTKEFELNWIRNAIEEPLDEMDIKAESHLE